MKKLIAACLLSVGLTGTMSLGGCTADNPMITEADLTVKTHFYPIVNGNKYKYVRYSNGGYDTATYQVRVGQTRTDMNYLDRIDSSDPGPQVLYYFALGQDQFGNQAALLKDSTQFLALAGNLEINGNPWIAQESPRMYGMVVKAYDEYIVSGELTFYDVIAVKYFMDGSEDYVLRFYAKNYGLIKEKRFLGNGTEIGGLLLIARSDATGKWIRQEDLPPIDHRFGRPWIMMRPDEEEEW